VRVALLVGELVVLAMGGDPVEHGHLQREAARDAQGDLHGPLGLERAVGEVAVQADGDAEAGDDVEDAGDGDVRPAEQSPSPGHRHGDQERDDGQPDDQGKGDEFGLAAGFWLEVGLRSGRWTIGDNGHGLPLTSCLGTMSSLRHRNLRHRK
jgi:hypothetical protein